METKGKTQPGDIQESDIDTAMWCPACNWTGDESELLPFNGELLFCPVCFNAAYPDYTDEGGDQPDHEEGE